MTRLYVQLSSTEGDRVDKALVTPEYVMERARSAMHPYRLEWSSIGKSILTYVSASHC